jgi:NADH-quinone oxidoreductase subunit M
MTELAPVIQAPYPLLALLQAVPIVGGLAVYRFRALTGASAAGYLLVLIELLLAADLFRRLDAGNPAYQFVEQLGFFGPFQYHAGADGLTVLFVLLTALVVALLVLYAHVRVLEDAVQLVAVTLMVGGLLISMLVTLDLMWFALASTLDILLVGNLIWHWAQAHDRDLAVMRFYQFQGTGLAMLFAGVLLAGWSHADATGGRWSFDLVDLMSIHIGAPFAAVTFFLLFFALAVRTPLFPFHGWLPVVAQHGSVAIAPTLLLGVKIGLYGMLRFVFPVFPQPLIEWNVFLAGLAVTGVFYAAFLAFLQSNLRQIMAFAAVSHTSLAALGLFALHPLSLQGGILLAATFGLAMMVMLFMVGFVYRRTGTTSLDRIGGLFDRIPFLGIAFLAGGFSIAGMPGTPGFDAAHLVLEASIERFGALATVGAALGNVVAAGFLLWAFQRAFLAPPAAGRPLVERARGAEVFVAGIAMAVLIVTGFYMEPWFHLIEAPLTALSMHLGQPGP